MSTKFEFEGLRNFQSCINREWVMTNGLGSYSSSTIIGAHTRANHGYLIASLANPDERHLVFSKTNEKIVCGSRIYDLATAQHKGGYGTEYNIGNQFLKRFTYDGTVEFYYDCGNVRLTKRMTLVHGEDICAIHYTVENVGPESRLTITPLINYRDHSQVQSLEGLSDQFDMEDIHELHTNDVNKTVGFYLSPAGNKKLCVAIALSEGAMVVRKTVIDRNIQLQQEVDMKNDSIDCHFAPIDFIVDVPAGGVKEISLICKLSKATKKAVELSLTGETAQEMIAAQKDRLDLLIKKSKLSRTDFADALVVAADQFVVKRTSTGLSSIIAGYPYMADRGREALISFTGLLLETKRFDEAREVLSAFAGSVKKGLVVNTYSGSAKADYASVDTSLWFIHDVYQFLEYVADDSAWDFVEQELYSPLQMILSFYRRGADYSIGMDEDGLLRAGSGLDALTWMNIKSADWVATPRHGKPVEINALWYNALMCMEHISRGLAKRGSKKAADYMAYAAGLNELATWVKDSFIKEFWNEDSKYLFDVVDGSYKDTTMRPNQIYAVSLPFSMLSEEKERAVVAAVQEKLYMPYGLCTLDADNKAFQSQYAGDQKKRDFAYHQGSAFCFLLGAFIDSYLKVYDSDKDKIKEASEMLTPIIDHLNAYGIGTISEVFDAKLPSQGRGCIAYAPSVAEILRIYSKLNS